jgi:hypothetical protein
MILYLPQLGVSGLTFVGLLFAADFRRRNPDSGIVFCGNGWDYSSALWNIARY